MDSNTLHTRDSVAIIVVKEKICDKRVGTRGLLNSRLGSILDDRNEVWEKMKGCFQRVIYYDFSNELVKKGFNKVNDDMVELVNNEKADFFIMAFAFDDNMIYTETLAKIREIGCKTIGFFVDDLTALDATSKKFIPVLDYIVTMDSIESVERYKNYGATAIFSPSGADTKKFYRCEDAVYKYDVTFMGSKNEERVQYIEAFKVKGVEITTFGSGWGSEYLSNEEMNRVFSESKINLNFTKSINGKNHLKWRTFEVPMAGGFLLSEDAPGIETCFKIGEEIDTFKSIDDCVEKINYYLSHDEIREAMREKAHKRALEEYTWEKRFDWIFMQMQDQRYENKMHDPLPETQEDHIRVVGRKTLYAMAFYYEIGKCKAYKDLMTDLSKLKVNGLKQKILIVTMKFCPYPLGKVLIKKAIGIYNKTA